MSLWSQSNSGHMNVSSVHLLYKLCFLLLLACFCFFFFFFLNPALCFTSLHQAVDSQTTGCTTDTPVNFCRKVLCKHLFIMARFPMTQNFIPQKHKKQLQAELRCKHAINNRRWPQTVCQQMTATHGKRFITLWNCVILYKICMI